jgi:starch-binding outer membrane protein, SusD/RagB family
MTFYSVARRALRPAGTLLAAVALSNCTTDTLDITDPDVINVGDVATATGVSAMRNGVIQDFTVVYSGTQDGHIGATGNLADEIIATDTFFDRLLVNERNMNPNLGGALDSYYLNLHAARAGATRTIKLWAEVKPTSKDTLSELYSIRGFVEDFFGEAFCSGVPFSEEDGSTETFGDPQTTTQVFTRAVATFDTALANATATQYRSLAAVGKGRALLNLGQFAAAAAAVSAVPTTFKYQVFHSNATGAQRNGLWSGHVVASSRYTIANNEGTNGLNYLQTPADPRVPWVPSTRSGFDGTTQNMPTQQKYPIQSSPATVADGIEARLIELEARLQGGAQADRDAVFAGLNTLRATGITPAIAALAGTAPTTQAAAVDQFFSERAKWLWLTGHRLGDMRRLIRQYGRAANTVFPIGPVATRSGSTYGNDVNFVIPFNETANPKFTGCLDRNP